MPFSVIKECLKTKKTTGIFKVFRKKLPKCLSEKKKISVDYHLADVKKKI